MRLIFVELVRRLWVMIRILTFLFSLLLLSACGESEQLRFTSTLPDEFAIISLRPLTLPPDYTLDVPTVQSESELSVNQLQDGIRASMLLDTRARAEVGGSDEAFLFAAKADKRDVDIRRRLEEENLQAISEPLSVTEAIALEESFPESVQTFFRVKQKNPSISKAK